jgi:hypothetical protein
VPISLQEAWKPAVVVFGPQVDLVSYANQLGRYADAVAFTSDAALNNVVHT